MMPVSRTATLFSIPFIFIFISIRGRRIASDGGQPMNGVFTFGAVEGRKYLYMLKGSNRPPESNHA